MEEQHTMDAAQRADELAEQALAYARNTLFVSMRFLETALCRFQFVPCADLAFGTDGEHLFYHSTHVLRRFQDNEKGLIRDYLHFVLHCIFRHAFVRDVRIPLWDLACDAAVENLLDELGLAYGDAEREKAQHAVFQGLRSRFAVVSAEQIYHHYQHLSDADCAKLRSVFFADDHSIWYDHSGIPILSPVGNHGGEEGGDSVQAHAVQCEQMWKMVSEQIQLDLETFSKQHGRNSGSMLQSLKRVNREKYDYTAFLRKFAVSHEAVKVNEDEFDYLFYIHGLQVYGDMPLIEPLEYKETKQIREFVIAIDTSGSVSGELVQAFVQKTYNILKSTESFASRINLHIIQCDARIQEDVKLTSQQDFDRYLETMQIHGLGGTDFRPVFRYVDELIAGGELTNLKGLLYFTDGFGKFPETNPAYKTAFVFVQEEYEELPDVPPWAIQLVLEQREICSDAHEGGTYAI